MLFGLLYWIHHCGWTDLHELLFQVKFSHFFTLNTLLSESFSWFFTSLRQQVQRNIPRKMSELLFFQEYATFSRVKITPNMKWTSTAPGSSFSYFFELAFTFWLCCRIQLHFSTIFFAYTRWWRVELLFFSSKKCKTANATIYFILQVNRTRTVFICI